MSFLEIQTRTGWGQVLQSFADWCQPQPGWRTLDVGCGPGLLPALMAERGCQAFGADLDMAPLADAALHPYLALADACHLPFPDRHFHLVTASNLLFFLEDPLTALVEITRLLTGSGEVVVLNPSEQMSVAAAAALAERRNLEGLARQSLLDWATRAEANQRWDETGIQSLFNAAGLKLVETALKVGPGLARFARGSLLLY